MTRAAIAHVKSCAEARCVMLLAYVYAYGLAAPEVRMSATLSLSDSRTHTNRRIV